MVNKSFMMTKRYLTLLYVFTIVTSCAFAQRYERYKSLGDTTIHSTNLGFGKKISIIVPIEWQGNTMNKFPLIIVFDRQNQRSNNHIINTIDYLTANEQIPSSLIISVASEQRHRYVETQYKLSDPNGLALENERFVFDELIPLAEKNYNASAFRLLIGHSRYGYFTTSLLNTRINSLSAIISMSPFVKQANVDLADSMGRLKGQLFPSKKYYRFAIGNDYPEDFVKLDSVTKAIGSALLDFKGYRFKEADHNATPGLTIGIALYDIFEAWSAIQSKYISNKQKDLSVKPSLEKDILSNYGVRISFSLGILNGKGWHFYNEKQYEKAIMAWEILIKTYPNFSETYLNILRAKTHLKQNLENTLSAFKSSLATSQFYTEKQKKDLEIDLKEIVARP
jgi:tetratricopeptide (TPR) repeat protein